MILIIVAFALIKMRLGGSVPLPANYQTLANGQIRIAVQSKTIPSTAKGEQWNLEKHQENNQIIYTANLYNNGREEMLFPGVKTLSKTASGTTYQASGKIRFGSTNYQAVRLFVASDAKSGYVDFEKTSGSSGSAS